MSATVQSQCDQCKAITTDRPPTLLLDEDGTARLRPPRGWYVVAMRLPGASAATLELACSPDCAAALASGPRLTSALGPAFEAHRKRLGLLEQAPIKTRRPLAPNLPVSLVSVAPSMLSVRIVGPFDGNTPLRALKMPAPAPASPSPPPLPPADASPLEPARPVAEDLPATSPDATGSGG